MVNKYVVRRLCHNTRRAMENILYSSCSSCNEGESFKYPLDFEKIARRGMRIYLLVCYRHLQPAHAQAEILTLVFLLSNFFMESTCGSISLDQGLNYRNWLKVYVMGNWQISNLSYHISNIQTYHII